MDCIFVDAADKHDRMPINSTDVDAMKIKGTYFSSQQFTSKENFENFIESNSVFGYSLSKNFFLYTIARQYAVKLKPTIFHKRNFPNATSMVAICQTRFLIISPNPKDMEEKRAHFSSTRVNGVTLIDINEDQSSEDETYRRASTGEYASGDDEPVKHFTPGTDVESFSGRKRSLFKIHVRRVTKHLLMLLLQETQ